MKSIFSFTIVLAALFTLATIFSFAPIGTNSELRINSESEENISRLITQCKTKSDLEVKKDNPLLPIYTIRGELCLSTLAKVNQNFTEEDLNGKAFIGSKVSDIITLKIPLRNLSEIKNFRNLIQLSVAERIIPHNQRMTRDTRADSVWAGYNLPQGYTGKNVLIGIADWGFDYDHPMFMDTNLTTSRVRAAWDQFKQSGNQPSFGYGVEYLTPAQLDNANSDTAGLYYDYATHGNHVAGIAGGSGAGTIHRGVAFESEFLFNSIRLDVGGLLDGFAWMKNIADTDNKRLIVNMSFGLYYLGTMDGTSLLSQAIDSLSAQGITFISSAGNNGDANFHIKKVFSNDSMRTQIQFYPYSAHPSMWGESISMWGEPTKPFNSRVEVYNASGQLVANSRYYNTNLDNGYFSDQLIIGLDTIQYNYSIDSAHPNNNRPHQRMRVKNTNTNLKVVLHSYAATGTVHYWNVVELSNGVGNWGLDFLAYGNDGVAGDNQYGIGEPACTESVITVGAHRSSFFVTSTGEEITFPLGDFSSRGPIYDERIKPDVTAPGVSVISSINSYTTANYTTAASTTFNGRTYDFAAFSGTSMSCPATAGVAALLLEANPALQPQQVKDILISTARQDDKTGPIPLGGNALWGHGKVTASAAIAMALSTVSIDHIDSETISLSVFPNPTNAILNFMLDKQLESELLINIVNVEGKIMKMKTITNSTSVDVSDLANGLYFVRFNYKDKSRTLRFVKR